MSSARSDEKMAQALAAWLGSVREDGDPDTDSRDAAAVVRAERTTTDRDEAARHRRVGSRGDRDRHGPQQVTSPHLPDPSVLTALQVGVLDLRRRGARRCRAGRTWCPDHAGEALRSRLASGPGVLAPRCQHVRSQRRCRHGDVNPGAHPQPATFDLQPVRDSPHLGPAGGRVRGTRHRPAAARRCRLPLSGYPLGGEKLAELLRPTEHRNPFKSRR